MRFAQRPADRRLIRAAFVVPNWRKSARDFATVILGQIPTGDSGFEFEEKPVEAPHRVLQGYSRSTRATSGSQRLSQVGCRKGMSEGALCARPRLRASELQARRRESVLTAAPVDAPP